MVSFGMEQAVPNRQKKRRKESRMKKPARAKRSQNRSRKNDGVSKSVIENRKAAQLEDNRLAEADLTNVELKRLLDRALVRFGNWKVQIESNPNPKMVHSLKSIVSIIETITSISNTPSIR